jgi:hypothetical protein
MRPSPVIRRIEHSAGNIFIDRIAKQPHRVSPSSKRDAWAQVGQVTAINMPNQAARPSADDLSRAF